MAIGFFGLYVVGRFVADMVAQQFGLVMHVRSEPTMHTLIMTASAIYFVLMAIPFMPGVEIAFTMILVLGSKIAFLVYICTLLALIPPFLMGRLIPARYCARAFKALGFEGMGSREIH